MLMKIGGNWIPHRIKDEIDTFSASKLGRGHEIRVSGNEYDLINLMFESKRGNV